MHEPIYILSTVSQCTFVCYGWGPRQSCFNGAIFVEGVVNARAGHHLLVPCAADLAETAWPMENINNICELSARLKLYLTIIANPLSGNVAFACLVVAARRSIQYGRGHTNAYAKQTQITQCRVVGHYPIRWWMFQPLKLTTLEDKPSKYNNVLATSYISAGMCDQHI